ncbi:HAMP domain-containing sensor histidine kinase [Pelagibacterium sp. H642]|uniref:sensor histidine kinase n=1 Tax=Pelagibacterium sp. H642 TaxID=1881069 RepID=UPI00281577BD|nr:HAMP domain-containing sensor histidine kinase [Pelagibacterium sp. H642]WMT89047.1 HAMP domain-containing histidine kinase [Pelagibacterium sp. H642]
MTRRRWNSLTVRLTRKLVLWQVVTLVIFALIASIPASRFEFGVGLDDRVVKVIADAVRLEDGSLAMASTKDLEAVRRTHPDFWFHVASNTYAGLSEGPIPPDFAPAIDNVIYVSYADFGSYDQPNINPAIIRQANTEAGPVHIATGGGPRFEGVSLGLLLANRYFVGFSAALSLMLMIAIPITLQRELRGLSRAADEAGRIDVDQRGVRLSQREIPEEMLPLVRAINAALARLDEGIERRQRFMADAAHELRTPIAILQMRIDLLPRGAEREQLLLDVARLSNLADQLLDLQRIDMGQSNFDTFDLVKLAESATADMAPLVIAANDEISFESDAENVLVRGDRVALSRAVTNLIQNAITHAGAAARIIVSVGPSGTVTVSDNGPGISPEQRTRIFDPFYRVKPSTRGAGLGLNLVQEIVLRHRGTIKATDSKLGGAAFTIALPPDEPTET